jgi:hypothetical protein
MSEGHLHDGDIRIHGRSRNRQIAFGVNIGPGIEQQLHDLRPVPLPGKSGGTREVLINDIWIGREQLAGAGQVSPSIVCKFSRAQ